MSNNCAGNTCHRDIIRVFQECYECVEKEVSKVFQASPSGKFQGVFIVWGVLNKHKFVQKVAKKNILLIYFEFSASITSVHKMGFHKIR